MTTPTTTISAELAVTLRTAGFHQEPIPTKFTYYRDDPYAVHAEFADPGGEVQRWILSRELLTNGLRGHVGRGDVQVWPADGPLGDLFVYLRFSSPDGEALLEFDAPQLKEFLVRAHLSVPDGDEHRHLDMDAVIRDLLATS